MYFSMTLPTYIEKIAGFDSTHEVLRCIYLYLKKDNPKYSMGYIFKAAGLSSKGYLSDILSGRRRLKTQHVRGMAKAMSLPKKVENWLHILVECEQEKDPRKRESLLRKRESVRKQLGIHHKLYKSKSPVSLLIDVFSGLSLTEGKASSESLLQFFPGYTEREITNALEDLQAEGMLSKSGDTYVSLKSHLMLSDRTYPEQHLEFLEQSIEKAKNNVRPWLRHNQESFFESSLVSVNKEQYKKLLPELKNLFERFQCEVETNDANELIRFNIQIYPSGIKRRKGVN